MEDLREVTEERQMAEKKGHFFLFFPPLYLGSEAAAPLRFPVGRVFQMACLLPLEAG